MEKLPENNTNQILSTQQVKNGNEEINSSNETRIQTQPIEPKQPQREPTPLTTEVRNGSKIQLPPSSETQATTTQTITTNKIIVTTSKLSKDVKTVEKMLEPSKGVEFMNVTRFVQIGRDLKIKPELIMAMESGGVYGSAGAELTREQFTAILGEYGLAALANIFDYSKADSKGLKIETGKNTLGNLISQLENYAREKTGKSGVAALVELGIIVA